MKEELLLAYKKIDELNKMIDDLLDVITHLRENNRNPDPELAELSTGHFCIQDQHDRDL